MDLKETYNKIAKDWHRAHQEDDWWKEGTDTFISFVGEGASVLDAGCGAGTKTKYLIAHDLRVSGIDFSEQMIDIARHEVPEAEFDVMDLYHVDGLKDSFDGIFAQAVLLHIPRNDAPGIVVRLAKKLKKGGYLYVAVKEKRPDKQEEEIKTGG